MEKTENPTIFELLIAHYGEMRKVMESLERILLSCETVSTEERKIQAQTAKKILDRDYVACRKMNRYAKSVLVKHDAEVGIITV